MATKKNITEETTEKIEVAELHEEEITVGECPTVSEVMEATAESWNETDSKEAISEMIAGENPFTEPVSIGSKHWIEVDDVVRTFAMNMPTGCLVLTNVGLTFVPTTRYDEATEKFCRV